MKELDYNVLLDALESVLLTNNKLNPKSVDRYVNQVLQQRWMPSRPFPILLVYEGRKISESHLGIGYTPAPTLILCVRVVCAYPEDNMTASIKNEMGIDKIVTPKESDKEKRIILREVENVIRNVESHRLGLTSEDLMYALPSAVENGSQVENNLILNWSELQILCRKKL